MGDTRLMEAHRAAEHGAPGRVEPTTLLDTLTVLTQFEGSKETGMTTLRDLSQQPDNDIAFLQAGAYKVGGRIQGS